MFLIPNYVLKLVWQLYTTLYAIERNPQWEWYPNNDQLKSNFFSFSLLCFKFTAVQHERGPRKPKPKPGQESTTTTSPSTTTSTSPSSGGRLTPDSPPVHHHANHPSTMGRGSPSTTPASHVSSSMYYGTFYHSLLAAEQFNISPMVLDLSTRGGVGKGGMEEDEGIMGVPSMMTNPESLPEVAARLLFTSVKWVKNIPCYRLLPYHDQVGILYWTKFIVRRALY